MSALFLISNDFFYFNNSGNIEKFNSIAKIPALKEKIKTILVSPTEEEIKTNLTNNEVCFFDFSYPAEKYKDLLIIQELPLVNTLLTTQEMEFNIDLRSSLLQKLQLEVIETTRTFKDLAGAEDMKTFFHQVYKAYDNKKVEKITVFLLGIPGAGKTYLAECVAGEFGYLLVKLDLSLIMHMDNPIRRLHLFFKYIETLSKQGEHVIALLDEIAQMLNGDGTLQNQFKGQLLTILEDLNSPRGYQVGKSMFIATENNIRLIMDTTPQFMRRWLESFFINFPKESEAKDMLKMYLKKYKVKIDEDNFDFEVERIYREISKKWRGSKIEVNLDENRFIYAPSEIAKFCSKLSIASEGLDKIDNLLIRKVATNTPAQQNMLKHGITAMLNDAGKGFIEI